MDKETIYFYYSRSGFFIIETTGVRILKSQGTNKINAHCTATLTLKSDKHTKLIRVELCDTHYDQDKQLGHLQISQSKPENHYTIKKQQTICQNCHIRCKECNVCIHEYTMCKCIDLVISV